MSSESQNSGCYLHDLFASLQDFTLVARDVELIVTVNINHFRVLGNKNLTVLGPFMMDADPLGWTQGEIVAINPEEWTIDACIFDGYDIPTEGERIEMFTTEGVMLPHSQDAIQVVLQAYALDSFPVWPTGADSASSRLQARQQIQHQIWMLPCLIGCRSNGLQMTTSHTRSRLSPHWQDAF